MTPDTQTPDPYTAPPDLEGLPDAAAEARAYDLALDLFGYPPKPPRVCPGCGVRAEPFLDGCCWRCCATGQRDLVMRTTLPHEWRRLAGEG